jgi:hypothetical protein
VKQAATRVPSEARLNVVRPRLVQRHPGAALLIALAGAMGMLYYHLFLFVPRALEVRSAKGLGGGYSFGNDFYPVWLTSREALLRHGEPYSSEITQEIQIGLFGRPLDARHPFDPPIRYREFAYPAFVDLLFWPLAYLPFPVVRVLLAISLPIITAGGLLLWLRAIDLRASPSLVAIFLLLTLCNYPILEALFAEQLGLVIGFALAACIAALTAGKYGTAGVLLALTTIKPQMVVLLIIFLLLWSAAKWRERHRLAESFAATEALLCCSALLVWPHWIQQWVRVLFGYRDYSGVPLVIDLLGPRFGPIIGPVIIAGMIGASATVAWHVRKYSVVCPEFRLAVGFLLAVTVVAILPGQAVYDHILLLPGILLAVVSWHRLLPSRRLIRGLTAIATAALSWQWIAALAIIAIRPLISSQRFYSAEIFALPIRMAEPFPFVLLILLAVVMRSVLRTELQPGARTKSLQSNTELS